MEFFRSLYALRSPCVDQTEKIEFSSPYCERRKGKNALRPFAARQPEETPGVAADGSQAFQNENGDSSSGEGSGTEPVSAIIVVAIFSQFLI